MSIQTGGSRGRGAGRYFGGRGGFFSEGSEGAGSHWMAVKCRMLTTLINDDIMLGASVMPRGGALPFGPLNFRMYIPYTFLTRCPVFFLLKKHLQM